MALELDFWVACDPSDFQTGREQGNFQGLYPAVLNFKIPADSS